MNLICGVDEAGRGPLAGPVIAAAVITDPGFVIDGLRDSKQLSPSARLLIVSEIMAKAKGYAIAAVSCRIIDKINILQASLLAMRTAIEKLPIEPEIILVDGNRLVPGIDRPQQAIVHGDRLIPQIAAASVLAKVARDAHMIAIADMYPEYGFERHKGYCTQAHLAALNRFGPCPIHRRSFAPVAQLFIREQAWPVF